jgi:hypothetical protein
VNVRRSVFLKVMVVDTVNNLYKWNESLDSFYLL